MASKTSKRTKLIKSIAKSIMDPNIYGTINYMNMNENSIKQFMYSYLVKEVIVQYKKEKKCKTEYAEKKAKEIVMWEGNMNTTINNISFMGTGNRPDFVVNFPSTSIAIEVKKGKNGAAIREGFGQSTIYTTKFDFAIYLFIDISKTKKIVNSINEKTEKSMINKLWKNNNVYFCVI
jgi:hypothetical protein